MKEKNTLSSETTPSFSERLSLVNVNKPIWTESSAYSTRMAPLQPWTKKWQISRRHFNVSIVQIKSPLTYSTHAQRYTWQAPPSQNQKTQLAREALNRTKGGGRDGLFPKALKTLSPYIAPTLSWILTSPSNFTDSWWLAQRHRYPGCKITPHNRPKPIQTH